MKSTKLQINFLRNYCNKRLEELHNFELGKENPRFPRKFLPLYNKTENRRKTNNVKLDNRRDMC